MCKGEKPLTANMKGFRLSNLDKHSMRKKLLPLTVEVVSDFAEYETSVNSRSAYEVKFSTVECFNAPGKNPKIGNFIVID